MQFLEVVANLDLTLSNEVYFQVYSNFIIWVQFKPF